jgi:membrane protein DedA with SNARE-associated domain
MSLEHLLITYGYPILALGAVLEGDAFVIVAALLAQRGYLTLQGVIAVAASATFCTDQFFFQLGRIKGRSFLNNRPRWQASMTKVNQILQRHHLLPIIGFRFLYGLRTITPIFIGMSGFSSARFLLLNALGSVVWAVVLAFAGYLFGQVIELIIADVQKYELWIIALAALIGIIIWVYSLYQEREPKV